MKTTVAAIAIATLSWGCSAGDTAISEPVANTTAKIDTSSCPAGTIIVLGTDGDDVLIGTNGPDCIVAGGGDDQLLGGNGDDVLLGGDGDDRLDGGNGSDRLQGGAGNDIVTGGAGNDTLLGGSGNDVLVGDNGNDTIDGGSERDLIAGGNGDDALSGGTHDDVIDPGRGGGTVSGGPGSDACSGVECELPFTGIVSCGSDAECPGGRCTSAGLCVLCTSDTECDDGNACTQQACQPALGCSNPHEADGLPCPNSTVCDGLERCRAGACEGGTPLSCSDGQFCNGEETCDAALGCQAGTPPVLDDGVSCTVDSCNESLDRVQHEADNAACNDGSFCNGTEVCDVVGGCQAGTPITCSPGYACAGSGCADIDECATDAAGCSPNASCTNTAGSYRCSCRFGFEGDGINCEPVCAPLTLPTGVERCVRVGPEARVEYRTGQFASLWVGPYTQADELNAAGEVLENHCGPTAVKNLLSWYGSDADYQALGEELRTNIWDGGTVFAAVALAGPLVGCVEPICWGVVTAIVSSSIVKAGTLPGDMLEGLRRRAPSGYTACMKSFDDNLENVRSALANGDPVIVLESGGAGNLHWSVATGLGFRPDGELIIRIDNATTGGVVSTWSSFHTRWSLAPAGDDALRGLLSALFGLHPFTYLRWIPADQADGDSCP